MWLCEGFLRMPRRFTGQHSGVWFPRRVDEARTARLPLGRFASWPWGGECIGDPSTADAMMKGLSGVEEQCRRGCGIDGSKLSSPKQDKKGSLARRVSGRLGCRAEGCR